MADDTCTIDGCDKSRYQSKRMCGSHFMKWYRYGDPHYKAPRRYVDITGQRFGTLTVVERTGQRWRCRCDCGKFRTVSAGDLNRRPDATTCGDSKHRRSDDAGYTAAHQRVRQDRGHIGTHRCADCDGPAAHWSYDHTDPDELYDDTLSARPVAYSLDPAHYSPRCVRCHRRYDLDRADARRLKHTG